MKTKNKWRMNAEPEIPVRVHCEFSGEINIEAAKTDAKGPRRFEMTAYTGGPMSPKVTPPLKHPVVVDLTGVDMTRQRLPALKDHDSKSLVGHTETLSSDGAKLTATGIVSGVGLAATEVTAAADNGFVWQTSIGADLERLEFLAKGKTAQVNGRNVSGPLYIARASRPRELSFLTMGADDDTSAHIAAQAVKDNGMNPFDTWLAANGFEPADKLNDKQRVKLQAQFDAETAPPTPKKVKAKAQPVEDEVTEEVVNPLVELQAQLSDMRREQTVHQLCAKHPEIAEKAIKEKWNDATVALAIEAADLKASLKPFSINTNRPSDAPPVAAVMEAAVCMTGNISNPEKHFDEKALNEAAKTYKNGCGLQRAIMECAWANGYRGRMFEEDMHAALRYAVEAQGFSTISVVGILSNTANKFILEGFMGIEDGWMQVSTSKSAKDFKTMTSYRLTGDLSYDELPPDGEIHHGTLGEQTYTNRVKTYAKMLAITRTDIINDDLDALSAVPRRLGRGAAVKLNMVFWTAFMENAGNFFHANNNNVVTTNALSIAGLTAAELKFLNQTDPDGEPLGIAPRILVVPNALSVTASQLMADLEVRDTTASTKYTTGNPHAGKFTVVRSSYLSNSTITGNSTSTWYLLALPSDLSMIEVAFLNGKKTPTVESADTDFNTLGIQWRGYHDFGVAKQEPRAAVKSTA